MSSETTYSYEYCDKNDPWVAKVKRIMAEAGRNFHPLYKIVCIPEDFITLLPIKFVQFSRSVLVCKREGYSRELYTDLVRTFVFYPDDYYQRHQNYYGFLEGLGNLQSVNTGTPIEFSHIGDLLDTYYMCVMSGKYADRFKNAAQIDVSLLEPVIDRIRDGYKNFAKNAYAAFESATVYSVLKKFYSIEEEMEYPDFQSAQIILPRIEEIVQDSVFAIGDTNTMKQARRFYGLLSTYMDTSVNDIINR